MDQYELASDPCDNRLIRCNNCLQILACFCDILALIDDSFRGLAFIFDHLADFMYHTVSGCMTAQVGMDGNRCVLVPCVVLVSYTTSFSSSPMSLHSTLTPPPHLTPGTSLVRRSAVFVHSGRS